MSKIDLVCYEQWFVKKQDNKNNYRLGRGHPELLDGRLFRSDSEQRPLDSNFTTVALVKLCCHNFNQIANFMIFFSVYYFL